MQMGSALFTTAPDGSTAIINRYGQTRELPGAPPAQYMAQQPMYAPPPPSYPTQQPGGIFNRFRHRAHHPHNRSTMFRDSIEIPSAQRAIQTVGLLLSLAVLGVGLVTVVKAAHKGSR